MKKRSSRKVVVVLSVLVGVFCIVLLQNHVGLVVRTVDIDVNSADLREQIQICFIPVSSDIRESLLSAEARRLGIALNARRAWRRASEEGIGSGSYVDYKYARLVSNHSLVVSLFDGAKTSDADRRAAVDRLITTLRTRTPNEAVSLSDELLAEIKAEDK